MADVNLRISVKNEAHGIVSALNEKLHDWPQSKKDAFAARWHEIEAGGAQLVEVETKGGSLAIKLSPSFLLHLTDFGVSLDATGG